MEGTPTLKHKDIPDAELVDMALSPVTQEEMDAAMKALEDNEAPLEVPEAEKISSEDMVASPVTEKEMQEAVHALYFEEPAPIGESLEESPAQEEEGALVQQSENSQEIKTGVNQSEAERVEELRSELQQIPPATILANDGPERNPRHVSEFEVEKKRCEKCKGTGKWFLFIRCPVCKGEGKIAKTMVFADGRRKNLSND